MITEKRKLELKAERDLTQILYKARDKAEGFSTPKHAYPDLTVKEIQNVINHYL
tara:strand:+ start:6763 stop:6924 length:162 start_codon:yes stop_codon:yes gene_type:complete